MAIPTCNADTTAVQNLPDSPALTPAELKAVFDKAGTEIKEYINDSQIPGINSTLSSAISTVNTTITTNQTANNTRFTTIEGKQSTDESNISTLQTTVSGQASSISSLQSTVSGHTTSISTINSTLSTKANSSDVYTKTQADGRYQSKITYGTGEPSGGNNGDVYFKYI